MNSQFGLYLKEQREKKGIRLEEIASITKVHLKNLELLEKGDWERLPPEPFIRGFILAYAKYVGLDTKDVLDRYVEETGRQAEKLTNLTESFQSTPAAKPTEPPTKPNAPATEPNPDELLHQRKVFPVYQTAVVAALVLLALGTLFLMRLGKHSSETAAQTPTTPALSSVTAASSTSTSSEPTASEVPQPSQSEKATKQVETKSESEHEKATTSSSLDAKNAESNAVSPSQPHAANTPAASLDKPAHEVVVIGKERTWIKVVLDDAPPIEYFLNPGEKATYDAKKKIKVVLGNSTGAQVYHNGDLSPGVKYAGTIRSYIFPAQAHFPQEIALKRAAAKARANEQPTPTPGAGEDSSSVDSNLTSSKPAPDNVTSPTAADTSSPAH